MKAERHPREYFDKFSDRPVEIRPFDPESKQQSLHYLESLNEILFPFGVSAKLFGSVELEIDGKGEWEFEILLNDDQWYPVLTKLINHFGGVYILIDDFAVFGDTCGETEIEVIPLRGECALRNQAIMEFWRNNSNALKEYEQGKYQNSHSKREYYWWKQNFIADIWNRYEQVSPTVCRFAPEPTASTAPHQSTEVLCIALYNAFVPHPLIIRYTSRGGLSPVFHPLGYK